jgi:hypothetical protein
MKALPLGQVERPAKVANMANNDRKRSKAGDGELVAFDFGGALLKVADSMINQGPKRERL